MAYTTLSIKFNFINYIKTLKIDSYFYILSKFTKYRLVISKLQALLVLFLFFAIPLSNIQKIYISK